jgi:hypothetical protein
MATTGGRALSWLWGPQRKRTSIDLPGIEPIAPDAAHLVATSRNLNRHCIPVLQEAMSFGMVSRAKSYYPTVALGLWCILLAASVARFGDNPFNSFPFKIVSLFSSKAPELTASERWHPFPILFVHHRQDASTFLHSAFLLFDFKQNLRHWPVLAGDISRSPPVALSF